VGFGDEIISSGLAKGAHARGRRIAFGNGLKIIWGPWCEPIFRGNPNVAPPGSERDGDIEWISHHKGNRIYNHKDGDRWVWHYNFKAKPGELFFNKEELDFAQAAGQGFIVIEPNVCWWKSVAVNKDWGVAKYQIIADRLLNAGYDVVQFNYDKAILLKRVRHVRSPSIRHGIAALSRSRMAILPEGGLHHGAAAVGTKAVVIFGGFIPPEVTGYDLHTNLTGGAKACGSCTRCLHCRQALDKISIDEVHNAAKMILNGS
jgi:ADP-heptose:LPS heptosyltransferase